MNRKYLNQVYQYPSVYTKHTKFLSFVSPRMCIENLYVWERQDTQADRDREGEGGVAETHIIEETALVIQENNRFRIIPLTFPLCSCFSHWKGLLIQESSGKIRYDYFGKLILDT